MIINVPEELKSHEAEIKRFFDAMIFKLAKNAHKGKWEGADFPRIRAHLQNEISELDEAIKSGNMVEIILEAADVGNFALILADIAIRDAK